MNIDDALQYIKDIQALSWKDLGYSDQMTRTLRGENSQFIGGADADAYYEEGSFQGAQIQSISANRIVTSTLEASVNVGSGQASTFLRMNGPKNRFESFVNGIANIIIGNPTP